MTFFRASALANNANHAPRVLLVTLSNIGDLVLTTPALIALHAAWPTALIDVVADQRSSSLLTHCPYLGDVFLRDKTAGLRGLIALVRTLRRRRYLAVVDLRTDFLPFLLRTERRSMRFLVRQHLQGLHSVEQHLAVVNLLLQAPDTPPAPRVWWPETTAAWAITQKAMLPGRVLALAPGANWAGKCWPLTAFIALAGQVAPRFESLLLLGSAAERDAAEAIAAASPLPSLNLAGTTSLLEVAAILAHCEAFVGNDSGVGHLAAAAGIPTLTVFGPGQPARYRPWGPLAAILCAPGGELAALPASLVASALFRHLAACKTTDQVGA